MHKDPTTNETQQVKMFT